MTIQCDKCLSRNTVVVDREELREISRQGKGHPLMADLTGDVDMVIEAVANAVAAFFKWLFQINQLWLLCKDCGHLKELGRDTRGEGDH